ncbi:MAG: hypothetical protein GXO86_14420, partial [Chlorobi bacterium]|nr:hypothetical protein [Chlorobiota bacterium]
MKKTTLTLLITLMVAAAFSQVAINTDGSSPNGHAMLDVKSSDKGMLIPRMTTAQRTTFGSNLGETDKGMMVYDTDLRQLYVFNGSSWTTATSYWVRWQNYVFNNTDSIGIGTSTPGSEFDVKGHIWQTGTGKSVFLGEGAGGKDDLTNNFNVAVGHQALSNNVSGSKAVAIGYRALFSSTKNENLIAIGDSALFSADSLKYAGYPQVYFPKNSIAIGNNALKSQKAGESNIVVGHSALENGGISESIVMGDSTLFSGHADNSVIIGNKALFNNIHVDFYPHESVIIGYKALYNFGNWSSGGLYSDISQNSVIGYKAFYDLTWGEHNVAIGRYVGSGITDATDNVSIGDWAMSYIGTPGTSKPQFNVAIGEYS